MSFNKATKLNQIISIYLSIYLSLFIYLSIYLSHTVGQSQSIHIYLFQFICFYEDQLKSSLADQDTIVEYD